MSNLSVHKREAVMEVVPDGADVLPYSVIAPQKMRSPGHHTAAVCMHACTSFAEQLGRIMSWAHLLSNSRGQALHSCGCLVIQTRSEPSPLIMLTCCEPCCTSCVALGRSQHILSHLCFIAEEMAQAWQVRAFDHCRELYEGCLLTFPYRI